ncbi:hypothetical protein FOPE_01273 [Fonsecaea pedrosoi]|nr:hypothetical protein FOPE_01273 [Fonsecaea pedrosoi]
MVDPLTTFAAAGNALQFALLGIDIIKKTAQYSKGGGNAEFETIRDVVQRLAVSSVNLQEAIEARTARYLPPGPARALASANMRCLELSREVTSFLESLGLNKQHTLWASVKFALRSHSNQSKLEKLQCQLEHTRANLMLSLLVCICDKSAVGCERTDENGRHIISQTQGILANSGSMTDDVTKLGSTLSSLSVDDNINTPSFEHAMQKYHLDLKEMDRRLSERLQNMNDSVMASFQDFKKLSPRIDAELRAKEQLMNSLWFSASNERRNRIDRAHQNTYQWIFKPKDNEITVWDDFVQWFQDEHRPCYWVSGKPGSGKSTLMRELDARFDDMCAPETSPTQERAYVKASFYFWYAGSNLQKSLIGCLRKIIHELLSQQRELIDQVISPDRLEACHATPPRPFSEWEETELCETMCRIVKQCDGQKTIVLFIDGLDEQDASDELRQKLLDLLQSLGTYRTFKACVSSRPWNIYNDAFAQCPKLRLEQLTAGDIRDYVHDNLQKDRHFQRHQIREPYLLETITNEVTGKARGVFLWVRLVVRDLLKVLRDGGNARDLLRTLQLVPSDLNQYFMRMFETIDPMYRKEASVFLQIALYMMDVSGAKGYPSEPTLGFLLLHVHFLADWDDQNFAAKSHIYPVDFRDPEDVDVFLELLERRVVSRSMGLFEVDPPLRPGTSQQPWNMKIEVMHRSVRDFFETPAAMELLYQHSGGPFDASIFRCNLLVTNMTSRIALPSLCSKQHSVAFFMREILARSDSEEASFLLFEKMTELVKDHVGILFTCISEEDRKRDLFQVLLRWCQDRGSAMSLAVLLQWMPYIKSRLSETCIDQKEGRPLLDYALRRDLFYPQSPNEEIVTTILKYGANPDSALDTRDKIPIWLYFLETLPLMERMDYSACFGTIKALLMRGVHTRVTVIDIVACHSEVVKYLGWWQNHPLSARRRNRLKKLAEDANTETVSPKFSFLQVVQSLIPSAGNATSSGLFSKIDVSILKELEAAQEVEPPQSQVHSLYSSTKQGRKSDVDERANSGTMAW